MGTTWLSTIDPRTRGFNGPCWSNTNYLILRRRIGDTSAYFSDYINMVPSTFLGTPIILGTTMLKIFPGTPKIFKPSIQPKWQPSYFLPCLRSEMKIQKI